MLDPVLSKYSLVIVDEAHERTVNTDVLLGLLKQIQKRREAEPQLEAAQALGLSEHENRTAGRETEAVHGAAQPSGGAAAALGQRRQGNSLQIGAGAARENPWGPGNEPGLGNGFGHKSCPPGPLKLIVMSATLQAERFIEFFPGARAVYVQGRQHPVEVLYTEEAETDFLDASLIAVLQVSIACLTERYGVA